MAEIVRFFDGVLYTESDQADTQKRFRPNGILPEYPGRLALSAPGGMFLRIAAGEAMVEGFHYKNTANLDLAVPANSSGSTRIDRVILHLDRNGNTLHGELLPGTPGAGVPPLTQVEGGEYHFLLGQVTIASGTLAIAQSMILGQPSYSSAYFAEAAPSNPNLIHNSAFRIDQRVLTSPVVLTGAHPVIDRWFAWTNGTNPGIQAAIAAINDANAGYNAIQLKKEDATALPANGLVTAYQKLEGLDVQNMLGKDWIVSFWARSNKTGTFGANIEQLGTNKKYSATFTINVAGTWEYKYFIAPWVADANWIVTTSASLVISFVAFANGTSKATVSNAWHTEAGVGAAAGVSNPLTANGDYLQIASPKLEVGTLPTRYLVPDLASEQVRAFRYVYVLREQAPLQVHTTGTFLAPITFPVPMRIIPSVSVPVAPTISNGAYPGVSQVGVYEKDAFRTGMTAPALISYLSSRFTYVIALTSTTASNGTPGESAVLIIGANIYVVFSADLG